ncbi:hypothetical protein SAMN02745123_02962 [Desulforamulus aeronauticus DSM 10349]|uniref:Uncharacterized protein n=1 Tax=Desulforamulus aeronauticus DSM 10349 TaxID=1121421 RepID=A0A1M6UXD1_9FIRM|nr:hypothetical protein [Desulforamulus aeronauticus]SHK73848.1 hypothetical protein SAMN02745123_02962 [Desulforamulus aeronauticus DSM 10349]
MQNSSFIKELAKGCRTVEDVQEKLKGLFKDNEIVIIENLMNLHLLGDDLFTFCALPLKHMAADGSPVRAIALLHE